MRISDRFLPNAIDLVNGAMRSLSLTINGAMRLTKSDELGHWSSWPDNLKNVQHRVEERN